MPSSISYQEVFAQNPLPMFLFDEATLHLLDVNAALAEEYGSSRSALLSLGVQDLLEGAPFDPCQPTSLLHRRPDGTTSTLKVTARLLQGTLPCLGVGVMSNVTQQEAAGDLLRGVNEQLVLAGLREQYARDEAERASRIKDEFLAVMSHELRTPLQAMLGWIELLRSHRLSAADADRALEIVERNTRMQSQLVADLLDVSRATSGKLHIDSRTVELRALLAEAIDSVQAQASRKSIRVESEPGGAAVPMQGDPIRLLQVIINLLTNAIKFTPEGGLVRVALETDSSGAHLRITDTGCGFEPSFAPKMFQAFSQENAAVRTRAQDGLGLGLMIVQHLVEAHGGRVRAESAGAGQGATFTVDMPLTDRAQTP